MEFVNVCRGVLTYPTVCALPLDPLSWYNGYIKRGRGKSMKNTQFQKSNVCSTNRCSPPLSSAKQPAIDVSSVTPRVFENCQVKNLYRLAHNRPWDFLSSGNRLIGKKFTGISIYILYFYRMFHVKLFIFIKKASHLVQKRIDVRQFCINLI